MVSFKIETNLELIEVVERTYTVRKQTQHEYEVCEKQNSCLFRDLKKFLSNYWKVEWLDQVNHGRYLLPQKEIYTKCHSLLHLKIYTKPHFTSYQLLSSHTHLFFITAFIFTLLLILISSFCSLVISLLR